MKLLDTINTPEDLRKIRKQDLVLVADEVRQLILETVSEKGGHFASNLGTVELAVALHFAFDTPRDKIVWDVGHQSYPHKILTGRKDRFSTIRQWGGISGFTLRSESPYDPFGAGHASTSISAALGMAEAFRQSGSRNLGIAVIGDGAMTGGLAFEALNNAGHIPAKNLLVILNDNEMSIDPNVGALSKFFNQAVKHPGYNRLRNELKSLIYSVSDSEGSLRAIASRARKSLKSFFTPGILFECFGFRYLGPVDGHNIDELLEIFEFIRGEGEGEGPYLVHVLTKKGKGYRPAEQLPLTYHGVNPFKIEDGIVPSPGPKKSNYQDVFADTLLRLAKDDPRVIAITAAMPSGTGLVKFQKEFPNRCYDVGIAEAHAVTFAAGLSTQGYRPVAAIYSTFLQRAYDQVIHDVALQNLPVVFAMDRAGLVGADGATHQGAFDLTYLRCLPNFVVMAPKDENELQHMVKTAVDYQAGPIAFRYPRGEVVGVLMDREPRSLPIGKGELVHGDPSVGRGTYDVLFVAIGYSVQSALKATEILKGSGVRSAVINARFVRPLDEKLILKWSRRARMVVTVEENSILGGFGTAVMELLTREKLRRETMMLGLPDDFVEHGTQKEQRKFCRLDGEGIALQVLEKRKKKKATRRRPIQLPELTSETGIFIQ